VVVLSLQKVYRKGDETIKLITKQEAYQMRKEMGNSYVVKTHSRYPKYYLVESPRALKALEQYRESIVVG